MLFHPAAALCCLCLGEFHPNKNYMSETPSNWHFSLCVFAALVTMAAELIQKDLTLTATPGKKVSFSCGTAQCSGSYVHWYQKKDGDKFRVILHINIRTGEVNSDYNHAQKKDFSAVKNENSCELEINAVSLVHSAIYYCSCAQSSHSDKISLQTEQKLSKEQQQTTAQVHTHTDAGIAFETITTSLYSIYLRSKNNQDQNKSKKIQKMIELGVSDKIVVCVHIQVKNSRLCKSTEIIFFWQKSNRSVYIFWRSNIPLREQLVISNWGKTKHHTVITAPETRKHMALEKKKKWMKNNSLNPGFSKYSQLSKDVH